MKKIIIWVIAVIIFSGVGGAGAYYWYKKRNEWPQRVQYKDIAEVDRDIQRLELERGSLRWQDSYRLGIAYIQRQRYQDAVNVLEESVNRYPRFPKGFESLGMAYFRLDDMEKAISNWEKAFKLNPESKYLTEIIETAKGRLRLKERVLLLEDTIKTDPQNWQKRFELAALYMTLRRIEDAKIQLEEVLKIKKDSPEVYDVYAQAHAISGDFEKAVDAEKKAVRLRPSDERFKKRLSEMEKAMER